MEGRVQSPELPQGLTHHPSRPLSSQPRCGLSERLGPCSFHVLRLMRNVPQVGSLKFPAERNQDKRNQTKHKIKNQN